MELRARIQQFLQRLRRRRVNPHAVRELQRSLGLIVDPKALEASVAARLQELFDPELLAVMRLDKATGSYRVSFCSGCPEPHAFTLPVGGRLVRWFLVNETCLTLPRDRGVYDYLEPGEREVLQALKARLVAPLLAANHLTGILVLGWSSPRDLRPSDAELLRHLASQASLAFENAALYAEQQERLDRLHRAERLAAVGQLAAGVAHEIRNPLTAIRSTMQYLVQALAGEDSRRELVEDLIGEVDRINGTINSLLSLARSQELQLAEIDPLEPLELALRLLDAQARKQQVQLERRFELGRFTIQGDAGQLKQVFVNLLLNALQAMPAGGTLRAAAEVGHLDAAAWLQVRITDTGTGIPEEQLRRAFDPFFTTKHEGTGLGLAICHGIIERHRGQIELQSRPAEGTTALVRLPIQR